MIVETGPKSLVIGETGPKSLVIGETGPKILVLVISEMPLNHNFSDNDKRDGIHSVFNDNDS